MASSSIAATGTGYIETISGAKGGVRFIPDISNENLLALQEEFCNRIKDTSRFLGGGFLYTSDIMFDMDLMRRLATVFAKKFKADIVPVGVCGFDGYAHRFFEKNMTLKIGKPISYELDEDEIVREWARQICEFTGFENRVEKQEEALV